MTTRFDLTFAFYRRLGLDIPASGDARPPVEVTLRRGPRLAWNTPATAATGYSRS
jgi:hypothetical protein